MHAKFILTLTLLVSLLFGAAAPALQPAEMKQGAMCGDAPCVRPCCANQKCCNIVQQQKAPENANPAPSQVQAPMALLGLRILIEFFNPPAPRPAFVLRDDTRIPHTLPPLAVSCIRLI